MSVLALGGAVGGCLLAALGIGVIRNVVRTIEGLPFWWDLRVDLSVLAFVASVAAVAAIAAGVGPAVFASRSNSHELLKDASRTTSSRRLGKMMHRLIAAEMAVFATFRAPVLAGRSFDTRDRAGALPVAVVTSSFE